MTTGHRNPISPQTPTLMDESVAGPRRRHRRVYGQTLAVVLVIIIAVLGYQMAYNDRVYAGVKIGDVDAGSMTAAQVQAVLDQWSSKIGNASLTLYHDEQQFSESFANLGVRLDAEASARRAMQVGRQGPIHQQLLDRLRALTGGVVLGPTLVVNQQALEALIHRVAETLDRPAREATVVVKPSGVEVTPSLVGLKVNIEETTERVRQALAEGSLEKVPVVVEQAQPAVAEAGLTEARSMAEKIISAPIALKYQDRTWTIDRATLAEMVQVRPANADDPSLFIASLDEEALKTRLTVIATEINRAPLDASITLEDGRFVIVPSQDGAAVDIAAATTAVLQASTDTNRTVALEVQVATPSIQTNHLNDALLTANKMISAPITLQLGSRTWTLPPGQIASMVQLDTSDTVSHPRVSLDQTMLTDYVSGLAANVNTPARNARVQLRDGSVSILADGQDGVTLLVDQTAQAISSQVATDERTVVIRTRTEKPKFGSDQVQSISVNDLLAKASTSYAGSIAARAHNVRLATSQLNGVVVAPGDEFSFNAELGPVTLGTGYQIGYGIAMANGQMMTVPSEGGGICQVATTVFHAAFWAGLDITTRYAHMYWIPRYGQPPLGMKGLDATVDDAYGIDFKFRNNTGNWLAIVTSADSSNIYFSLYGTDPNWEVKAEGPIISNIVPADTTMVRQFDPSMAPGQELLVEHAENGFDARVIRRVLKNGQTIDTREFVSHYMPSRNVMLVGPSVTPTSPTTTPAPSSTPNPTPTPGEAASPTPPTAATPTPEPNPTQATP